MPVAVNEKLLVWGLDHIEPGTLEQAAKTSRLDFVERVALMPDAHVGIGSTVGSVIPTTGAIIPAAVGVDIGCGMAAVRTSLTADQLPDDLQPLLARIEMAVPAGVGRGHGRRTAAADYWLGTHQHELATTLTAKQEATAAEQFGTLGSGNHFFEVSLDEVERVWIVLHSGSRGIGNQLAQQHIGRAKCLEHNLQAGLEDPDLASFTEGTTEFQAYMADLLWAQGYARVNRDQMLNAALDQFFDFVGHGEEVQRVNCHHNYTAQERHNGRLLWISRKGAIRAGTGDLGIIPGSMGTDTYIVEGLGNPASYHSSSHGAGRRHSRSKAKKLFTAQNLTDLMGDRTWNADHAEALLDEIPEAYKDIAQVMAAQSDLVEILHRLTQVFNYKGYKDGGDHQRK